MKKRLNWFDQCKAAAAHGRRIGATDRRDDDQTDTTWFDELREDLDEVRRERRASDSAIAASILAEPDVARSSFRTAIRRLAEHFETALDATGSEKAAQVLERIHEITGDRRRKRK